MNNKTFVLIFQRFAPDWLNFLVPASDSAYYDARPNIAVENPLPLTNVMGLNPLLTGWKNLYDAGDLGFVTATGWPDGSNPSRSHFLGQDRLEVGAMEGGIFDGWMSRLGTELLGDSPAVFDVVACEDKLPTSLSGNPAKLPAVVRKFSEYNHGSSGGDEVTQALKDLAQAIGNHAAENAILQVSNAILKVRDANLDRPSGLRGYPNSVVGRSLRTAADAIKAGLGTKLITISDESTYDTHINQVSTHQMMLPSMSRALEFFAEDLGPRWDDVVVVSCTEFGRRVEDNGSGTEHGDAFSMLFAGGSVNGGQVLGDFPGCGLEEITDRGDLRVTTDYRHVISSLIQTHMGLSQAQMSRVFPSANFSAPILNV